MPDSTLALRNAENNAISHTEPSYTDSSSDSGGYYTGSGRSNSKKKKKGGIRARAAGAIISIALLLGGGGAFLSFSNATLPAAISHNVTTQTQTDYTSYIKRFEYIAEGMMDNAGASNPLTKNYSKFPNYMKERFAKFGINVTGSGKDTRITWRDQTMDREGFAKMYRENIEFRNDVTKAKRGRVATFFDNIAENFFGKKLNSRNAYPNYRQTSDTSTDVDNYKDVLHDRLSGDSTNLNTIASEKVEKEVGTGEYDADGNEITQTITEYEPHNTSGSSQTGSEIDTELAINATTSKLTTIAQNIGELGSGVCTALKVGSMIGIAAAAQETYQYIKYFLIQIENISKMMAGEGDASAINEFLNFMSTPATTNVSDFDGVTYDFLNGQQPAEELQQKTETGSPLEASGLLNMLSGAPVSTNSTQNYSIERILKTMNGAFAMTAGTMKTCAGFELASSIVSIAIDVFSNGTTKIISNIISSKFVYNVAITITISSMFSFLVPTLAQIFFANTADLIGIPAGQAFASGAAATNMQEGRRGSGQSISSESAAKSFNNSTRQVLAMEAELDRYNLSPFDTSSPNTFFGSIAYSLLPTITSTNMTGTSSFIRSTTKSLSSLLSHVSATDNNDSYTAQYGNCLLLEEIGAVGDVYCNPIVTTDMSTINLSPNDAKYVEVISKNVEYYDTGSIPSDTTPTSSTAGSDVTIIGDSITVQSENEIKNLLPKADIYAQSSKHFNTNVSGNPSGLSILNDLKNSNSLRKKVIFALGTNDRNALNKEKDIDAVIDSIGSDHEIYFITNYGADYLGNRDYSQNNQLFKNAEKEHNNVFVIDWADIISKKDKPSDYVPSNDVHPTSIGREEFAKAITNAVTSNSSNNNSSTNTGEQMRIIPNSNLAKYIAFCDNRDSPFGAIDQNILGALQPSFTGNPIINSIPVIGNFADIVDSVLTLDDDNLEWANGQKCGNTEKNTEFWQSEGKYYQRYVEDQRILEQMGAFEGSENPVTAFIEQYEKEYEETHPEANTYIGYLSRISGLTPENTETVLAFVEYYTFVDQYDPTLRIAMDGDTTEPQSGEQVIANIQSGILRFDNPANIDNPLYAENAAKYIAYVDYSDLRNRSYAI